MGLCLSKGGHGQYHGQMQATEEEDDGFCTPEGVSSQFESPNPSGRYSFAHLDTPRMSADVGDLGALGSLFYKRGSRSRSRSRSRTRTMSSNYISPLDMFLGGVSGRNRVHHVNQICAAGDCSFASYLASPLLKGFDVHAMEAVAKSYAESAALAAARDAFVFLEENDASTVSLPVGKKVMLGVAGAEAEAGDCEDVDDDLAKSWESEEWEESGEPVTNSVDLDVSQQSVEHPAFRAPNAETNERWMSVLSAIQARAKARRSQKRKGDEEDVEGFKGKIGGLKRKTVRFQLPGVAEGLIDEEDIWSGKESEIEAVDEGVTDEGIRSAKEFEVEDFEEGSSDDDIRPGKASDFLGVEEGFDDDDIQSGNEDETAGVEEGDFTDDDSQSGMESKIHQSVHTDGDEEEDEQEDIKSTALSECGEECSEAVKQVANDLTTVSIAKECGYALSWQDDESEAPGLGEDVSEGEFAGFRGADISNAIEVAPGESRWHVHHASQESFSSSEYFLSDTSFEEEEAVDLEASFRFAHQEEQAAVDSIALPQLEEDDSVMCAGIPEADKEVEGVADVDEVSANGILPVSGQSGDTLLPPLSSENEDDAEAEVKEDVATRTIHVGCVVVENRMADGSRLTPQILDLSEVRLPERGDNNIGVFRAGILYSGSSASGSEPNSDHEGGAFSFPVLVPFSNRSSENLPFKAARCPWREPPLANFETPIMNRTIRPHLPAQLPTNPSHDSDEMPPERSSPPFDSHAATCDPRGSFSFDTEMTGTKRTHEIVLPSRRSLSSTPVFSPSKHASSPRYAASPWAPAQVSSIPRLQKSRRGLNRKLKFYSLERASHAAGAKKSKSLGPPSFNKRDRRRDTDGDSDSDLFEIETMSGTNAMGSSRTPPSTPTTILRKPAAASFDIDRLTSSMSQVGRSRSRRNNNIVGKEKGGGSLIPMRGSENRCLPGERKRDGVFQEQQHSTNSLKGRAMMKLGLLRRNAKSKYGYSISHHHSRETPLYRSSEMSGSEYLENNPPASAALNHQGQCGRCLAEEERRAANHNYAFEWYCSATSPHLEKREQGFSTLKRNLSNEDRTFAVKN